jgi:hypothetical protein
MKPEESKAKKTQDPNRSDSRNDATPSTISLFHQPWWLSTVSAGQQKEVVVERGGNVVGRLPYCLTRVGPFLASRMPPLTHLLGPWIDSGSGKLQTRMVKRLSVARELIDQLPRAAFFEQIFDPSMDDGLAGADGLAFQDRGFSVAPQYTFEVDCRQSVESLWDGMHFKTRQHIRRAEEKYSVRTVDDPKLFADTYSQNLKARGLVNRLEFDNFPALYQQCSTRDCAQILSAFSADGSPVSMAYLVWSPSTMYFLMSTRSNDPADNGSVNLLLWAAMKQANERGLLFDLDGVHTSGTARFLCGFGGRIKTRLVVRKGTALFNALRYCKLRLSKNETHYYT